MVRITLVSNSNRRTVTADISTTVQEILDENNISTTGAAVHLDGMMVQRGEYDYSLDELGIEDETEVTMVSVIKADSAF